MRASDRAYAALKSDIVEWRLIPGTVLAEVEQSARLGVSRTPLREALARLSAEGLTAAQTGRGVVVTDISLAKMTQLFDVRLALDCKAAELAAVHRDPHVFTALAQRFEAASSLIAGADPDRRDYYALVSELDVAVDDAADNQFLRQAQGQLRAQLVRIRRLAKDNSERLLASAAEHAQIARSIAGGNTDLAIAATKIHLHNSLAHLLASKLSFDAGFAPSRKAHLNG
ncbi:MULTISPECIES: GntR family transcriptional regulator [unclassified Arthrobacter]|uniref:GntR family transcriptional regulator n=1 Tax=unclassified Arthrobacter TaxID=235627 RepID=UPI0003F8777F|nr:MULTISPECIES: GntR family transcriptional regulator [unclassified Arthrobacter]PVE15375.1 GntR family transcriptional regulator [Arthrobacter sp. Bz4]